MAPLRNHGTGTYSYVRCAPAASAARRPCCPALKNDDIRILRDIEQYYSTQIDEMPMNVADLI